MGVLHLLASRNYSHFLPLPGRREPVIVIILDDFVRVHNDGDK